jgi:hypothetical protein
VSITLQLTLRNGDDDAPVLSPVLKRATSLRKDMLHRFLLEQPTENFVPAICSRNKLSGFQVAAGAQEEIAIPSRFFLSSPLHPGTKQNKSPLGLCCCHSLLYYLLVMGHLNGGCLQATLKALKKNLRHLRPPFAKSCSLFSSQKRQDANQVSLMIVESRGEEFLAYPNCDRVFYRMENKTLGGF